VDADQRALAVDRLGPTADLDAPHLPRIGACEIVDHGPISPSASAR
jgi:hypothetical protein